MPDQTIDPGFNPIELASDLTVAWLSNPNVRVMPEEVPAFLRKMHETIGELAAAAAPSDSPAAEEFTPAVPVRSSVKPDHIISLIDGRPYKALKRHLSSHGLTPAQYRERYGLKADYPMVAPNYAETRRQLAKKIGLGRMGKGGKPAAKPAGRRGRPPKA